jgi:type IV pilus assembly protein PilX
MTRATQVGGGAVRQPLRGQRGLALITALLLLLVITLLGLSMFRSFPTQEKIAGNVREKERALHAATSAQQFAEWWLVTNVALSGDQVCAVQAQLPNANQNPGLVQICSNPLYTLLPGGTVNDVANNVPWGGGLIGAQYTPVGMTVNGIANPTPTAGDSAYAATPVFYIADLGGAGDAQGEAYQIDAYAYGGSTNTVAVVESIYEVQQGVVNRSGE